MHRSTSTLSCPPWPWFCFPSPVLKKCLFQGQSHCTLIIISMSCGPLSLTPPHTCVVSHVLVWITSAVAAAFYAIYWFDVDSCVFPGCCTAHWFASVVRNGAILIKLTSLDAGYLAITHNRCPSWNDSYIPCGPRPELSTWIFLLSGNLFLLLRSRNSSVRKAVTSRDLQHNSTFHSQFFRRYIHLTTAQFQCRVGLYWMYLIHEMYLLDTWKMEIKQPV